MNQRIKRQATVVCASLLALALHVRAGEQKKEPQEDDKSQEVSLSQGRLKLTAPMGWEKVKPRNNIVEYEFAVPATDDDTIKGRVTVMGAGGEVQANVRRWMGQFIQPDGVGTNLRTTVKEKKIAGQEVHFVDITGTYRDQPRGPLGDTTLRENFRMLGAIIVTEKRGRYFAKVYGPRKTIAANEEAFQSFVESLQVAPEKDAPKKNAPK